MINSGSSCYLSYYSDSGSAVPGGAGSTLTQVQAIFVGFERERAPELDEEESYDVLAVFYETFDRTVIRINVKDIEDLEPVVRQ